MATRPAKGLISRNTLARSLMDGIPTPAFVVDDGMRMVDSNAAGVGLLGRVGRLELRRLCGEVLHCIRAAGDAGVCGTTPHCPDCVLRQTLESAVKTRKPQRRLGSFRVQEKGRARGRRIELHVTASPLAHRRRRCYLMLLEDVTELVTLQRLIPICSYCRKVRDDKQYWHDLETYLRSHLEVSFTHGICPDCFTKHHPGDAD